MPLQFFSMVVVYNWTVKAEEQLSKSHYKKYWANNDAYEKVKAIVSVCRKGNLHNPHCRMTWWPFEWKTNAFLEDVNWILMLGDILF